MKGLDAWITGNYGEDQFRDITTCGGCGEDLCKFAVCECGWGPRVKIDHDEDREFDVLKDEGRLPRY